LGGVPAVDVHTAEAVVSGTTPSPETKSTSTRSLPKKPPVVLPVDDEDNLEGIIIPDFISAIEQKRAL
jgi:hypothetical protein